MQYSLPLQKFTFAHGYTQNIAITPSERANLQLLGEKRVCSRMATKYLSYTGPAQHPAGATAAFPLGNAGVLLSL